MADPLSRLILHETRLRLARPAAGCYYSVRQIVRKVSLIASSRIIGRGSLNWIAERPIVVSFEVTDSCTCYCRHCDHGGPKDDSANLRPHEYRRCMEALRPCVVQVSGGEPMMRDDLVEIVGRRADDARRSGRNRAPDQGPQPVAVHHPGIELVADDGGALPGVARGDRKSVV